MISHPPGPTGPPGPHDPARPHGRLRPPSAGGPARSTTAPRRDPFAPPATDAAPPGAAGLVLTHAVLDALRRVPPGASGHLLGTRGRDGRPDHARFATRDPERTDGHAAARALARAAGLVVLGRWTAGPAPRTAPDALEPGLHLVLERLDAPLDGTLDGALDPSRAGGPPDRGAAAADAVPRAWRGHAFLVRDDGRLERAPLALLDPRRRPAPEER